MKILGSLIPLPQIENFHTKMKKTFSILSSVTSISLLALVFSSLTALPVFAWDNLAGGDHGGSDWTISSDITLSGTHTNIGTFTINSGITATVKAHDGTNYGSLAISAQDISIIGIIDASGAGFVGGPGGGGGGGGYAGHGGAAGANYKNSYSATAGTTSPTGAWDQNGMAGGRGATARGSYFGASGAGGAGGVRSSSQYGQPGGTGTRGGYGASATNGDTTTDEDIWMGSGGGGAGGGGGGFSVEDFPTSGLPHYVVYYRGGGGGGGGSGGNGGGSVKLISTNNLTVSGTINTKGVLAGNGVNGITCGWDNGCTGADTGNGGAGGSPSASASSAGGAGGSGYPAGAGGTGGAGAGGGLLLKAPTISLAGSTLDARGGGSSTTNGGTIKILYSTSLTSGTIYSGRTFTSAVSLDGICGSANGVAVVSAPTTNLCSVGTPSSVLGSGPWTWDCVGLNGGITVSCGTDVSAVDSGLRAQIGGVPIPFAVQPLGTLTSPLRIQKGATTLGIILVEITDPAALPIRIKTADGIKALRRI